MKAIFADEEGCVPRFVFGDCGLLMGTRHVQDTLNVGTSTEGQGWGLGNRVPALTMSHQQGQSGFCPALSLDGWLEFHSLKQKVWCLTTKSSREVFLEPRSVPRPLRITFEFQFLVRLVPGDSMCI